MPRHDAAERGHLERRERPQPATWVALALLAVSALGAPSVARAGGFYLTDRGVRPMGRGFAFTAGADDPQALWYNPAGLTGQGQQLLLDASMTFFRGSYARVDSGGNDLPRVEASGAPAPIPMIGYVDDLGRDDFAFGVGVLAPNAVLLRWPRGVNAEGRRCDPNQPGCEAAPQRYSLYDMNGSALLHVVAAAAYEPLPWLSIGAGLQLMLGSFQSEVALSACDRFICSQPENPEWDAVARVRLSPVVEPGLQFGLLAKFSKLRIGVSMLYWPTAIRGDARIDVRLPSAPLFDGARVEGNRARVRIDFPLTLRGGVEFRPTRSLRIEADVSYEGWSSQRSVSIRPKNVWIRDAIAIGDYQVGEVSISREMRDVLSLGLGVEADVLRDQRLSLRGGLSYSNSGFDSAHLTALTLDSDKLSVGFGASVRIGDHVFLDASYAHVFMKNQVVSNSVVEQSNPIRPAPAGAVAPTGPVFIGNGRYTMEADMVGLGVRWTGRPPAGTATPADADESADADEATTSEEEPEAQAPIPASPAVEPSTPADPTNEEVPWYYGGGR
ncbi:MAG: hypothetical protein GXP55_00595 [Deltaproteobacteria bacterium]|nr:hypothetical protein [Deltaproteobacteria bacterium]